MREISATSQGETPTPIERCFERLVDIAGYPSWYPTGVKRAEQLEQGPDGRPTKVAATLALTSGPIQRDFSLEFGVTTERPTLIELRRLPHGSGGGADLVVISWRLRELAADRTELTVAFDAELDVPRFLPLGGLADGIAGGFLAAAIASLSGG